MRSVQFRGLANESLAGKKDLFLVPSPYNETSLISFQFPVLIKPLSHSSCIPPRSIGRAKMIALFLNKSNSNVLCDQRKNTLTQFDTCRRPPQSEVML